MQDFIRTLDDASRRGFMARVVQSAFGVSFLPFIPGTVSAASGGGKAKYVIYLFMDGGMSQLDTFDLKPDNSEVQGATSPIQTSVSGIRISHTLPELARRMNDFAIVRSLSTPTGDHDQGKYIMRTSYKQIASIRHPFLGSWIHHLDGRSNNSLPGSVTISAENRHPGCGFMRSDYAPAPVANPDSGLQNTRPPGYLKDKNKQFERRLHLTRKFDREFRRRANHSQVQSYVELYREATRLMQSDDLEVFDIRKEPEEVRKAYGSNQFGKGCMLARRLIERQVRFVDVNFGGWDMHDNVFQSMTSRAAIIDQGLSVLIDDLKSRGLFDETLVVLTTEFGRTPRINKRTGRDHHPGAFSAVLAGGGIRGGQIYGETDKRAESVEGGHVSPMDLNATIAYAVGLRIEQEIHSRTGRPFTVAHDGVPVEKLFG